MALVQTTIGLLDSNKLEIKDVVEMNDMVRTTATEWYSDGELVRRDLNINVLCGHSLTGEQEEL